MYVYLYMYVYMYIGDELPPSSSSKSRSGDHDDSTQGLYIYRINQLIDMEELLVAQAQRYILCMILMMRLYECI